MSVGSGWFPISADGHIGRAPMVDLHESVAISQLSHRLSGDLPVDEERARELLDNLGVVRPDGTLGGTGKVYWPARYHLNLPARPNEAELDGFFTADELEAIAWWIRNKKKACESP